MNLKSLLRRLRGIVGSGAVWGSFGAILGSLVSLGVSLFTGVPLLVSLSTWALGMGVVGVVLGVAFGTVITLTSGRRTLAELSPGRAAAWGGVAGAVFPLGWVLLSFGQPWTAVPLGQVVLMTLASVSAYAAVGALLGGGTVWLARRAPDALESGPTPLDYPALPDAEET